MSSQGNGVRKPKINTSKSSDRRLAAGRQPDRYLHGSVAAVLPPINASKLLQNRVQVDKDVKLNRTVKREGGGKTWEDSSLLEWDPQHYRLFVGNLGSDANDALLVSAFGQYPSVSKVKVPVDKRTGKNKGYGFVSFASAEDYFQAFKEMNGKYIGHHPVQLKRAETEIKPTKKKRQR